MMPPPEKPAKEWRAVSRDDLVAELESLKGEALDPVAGLFGPNSLFWQIGRHATAFLGAGRAALLQNAHPWVATAIQQHSTTMGDPMGRFRGTFSHVYKMIFGPLDQVIDSALKVHRIHEHIHGVIAEPSGAFAAGSHYQANNVPALLWVHATLWDTTIRMYELIHGELDADVKERYYQEAKLFARLFGIPAEDQPPTWPDFVAYNEAMWQGDHLCVTPAAKEISRFLFTFSRPLTPLLGRFEIFTSMIMPPRLRQDFGLPPATAEHRAAFERNVRLLRRIVPRLPRSIRYLSPYLEARRRIAGKPGAGLAAGTINRILFRTPRLVSAR